MTMISPFAKTCDRCGESYLPKDVEKFRVSYQPLGDSELWVTINLCDDCQHELRNEFYKRGMTKAAK